MSKEFIPPKNKKEQLKKIYHKKDTLIEKIFITIATMEENDIYPSIQHKFLSPSNSKFNYRRKLDSNSVISNISPLSRKLSEMTKKLRDITNLLHGKKAHLEKMRKSYIKNSMILPLQIQFLDYVTSKKEDNLKSMTTKLNKKYQNKPAPYQSKYRRPRWTQPQPQNTEEKLQKITMEKTWRKK